MAKREDITTKNTPVTESPSGKPSLEFQRKRDREPVRGKFIFHEVPGGQMSFPFRAYKGDPVENFTFVDGGIYTIPLGVAKHLNKNCWYPKHTYAMDDNNRPVMRIGEKVQRCSFRSLEFLDIEELHEAPSIVTVEATGF